MQHTSIENFRKNYSISQEALAAFLGVSLSLLAMAETGQRSLPQKAATRLLGLQDHQEDGILLKVVPATNDDYFSFMIARDQQVKMALLDLAQEYMLKLHRLYKQQRVLQQKQDKALSTIALMHAKLTSLAKGTDNHKDNAWAMGVLIAAKDSLQSIPAGSLQKINIKIAVLDAQVIEIQKQVRRMDIETGLREGSIQLKDVEEELKALNETSE